MGWARIGVKVETIAFGIGPGAGEECDNPLGLGVIAVGTRQVTSRTALTVPRYRRVTSLPSSSSGGGLNHPGCRWAGCGRWPGAGGPVSAGGPALLSSGSPTQSPRPGERGRLHLGGGSRVRQFPKETLYGVITLGLTVVLIFIGLALLIWSLS